MRFGGNCRRSRSDTWTGLGIFADARQARRARVIRSFSSKPESPAVPASPCRLPRLPAKTMNASIGMPDISAAFPTEISSRIAFSPPESHLIRNPLRETGPPLAIPLNRSLRPNGERDHGEGRGKSDAVRRGAVGVGL